MKRTSTSHRGEGRRSEGRRTRAKSKSLREIRAECGAVVGFLLFGRFSGLEGTSWTYLPAGTPVAVAVVLRGRGADERGGAADGEDDEAVELHVCCFSRLIEVEKVTSSVVAF